MGWNIFKSDATLAKEVASEYPNQAEVYRRNSAKAFSDPNGMYMKECKSRYKFTTEEELYNSMLLGWYKEYSKSKYNRTGNALKNMMLYPKMH
jgi:hypothetical protein